MIGGGPGAAVDALQLQQQIVGRRVAIADGDALVEHNYISVSFSLRTGYVQLTFSSSLYDESQTEFYREETMEYAVAVHDWMWETGVLFGSFSFKKKN